MNREEPVLINRRLSTQYNLTDAVSVLSEYCAIHNKDCSKILPFINALPAMVLHEIISESLEYLNKKYNITMLYDNKNNLLLIF